VPKLLGDGRRVDAELETIGAADGGGSGMGRGPGGGAAGAYHDPGYSLLAGDTSNIATSSLTVPIVNGVLQVKLVPTTTASAGAQYNITYNSGGQTQFTEIWAVPPSTFTLRVSDVRVSTGTVVGPPPVMSGGDTSSFPIGDVIGLANALGVRPQEGTGFVIGRTAIINQAGQIDGSAGALGNCVHVDGSSGP
jgi:hypothetical protein